MRCHWSYTEHEKFWLPACMSGIYGPEYCTCGDGNYPTFEAFERAEFRLKMERKEQEIKDLQQYIHAQNRIIAKLIKAKKKKEAIPI